jgi:multidrug resistance efflux pump
LAERGEIVSTGTPVLVVSDINRVKVNAYIPENQLSQIRIGQEAQVLVGALVKPLPERLRRLAVLPMLRHGLSR